MIWRWVIHLLVKHRTYKFREWIDLEDRKIEIAGASDKDKAEFPQLILSFLSDALPIPQRVWARLHWVVVMDAFIEVAAKLSVRRYLPIVSLPSNQSEIEHPPWHYQGRNWYYYSRMLAHEFGWSLEYIASLNVYDAMALIEEALVDHQFEREFLWSMSEASVIFDTKTKTSKPNPLPRPYWMTQTSLNAPIPIKKINIPKSMMPVGLVNYDALPEEFQPKEADVHPDVGTIPDTGNG